MLNFGRGKVRGNRLCHSSNLTIGDDGDTFDPLVVILDEVHVRSEPREILPSGKFLGVYQYAVESGVIGKVGIDSRTEPAEILFA